MIDYSLDADGIAIVCQNQPDRSANVMNAKTMGALFDAVDKALADDAVKGIIITSAKKDFMAGGDLEFLLSVKEPADILEIGVVNREGMRRMEKGGKPVVAAINGTALGGGLELCLACHHRIASDRPGLLLGLPEVTLGLLPGAGGTQRLPRMIGVKAAMPLILDGTRMPPAKALELGIIDAIAPAEDLLEAARKLILSGEARSGQPWDEKGFKMPGGPAAIATDTKFFAPAVAARHASKLDTIPAHRNAMACLYHGSRVDFDTALTIERRYFANCVISPEAKNIIRTSFFSMAQARKLAGRPDDVPTRSYSKVGILGAGMMGAGIAYSCAAAGMEVVLLDRDQESADRGKGYSEKVLDKRIARGRSSEDKKAAHMARILATTDYADLDGCEMIIEAVFEDRDLKADVTKKTEAVIGDGAIFASNTSTLPITGLAEASKRPAQFIGLHFFSPADRMPLVEVIVGEQTTDKTLAEALDFVAAIRKTPIVVNDARAFYTSRVFRTYVNEGLKLLSEGVAPALIENAAKQVGMAVGPLTVCDEVSIELGYKVRKQTRADMGDAYVSDVGEPIVTAMYGAGRLGRKAGGGFFDYHDDGSKAFWPGLSELFPRANQQPDVEEVMTRLAYVQSVETARCLDEGVLRNPRDADVGALLGWGYPAHRGGTISQIHTVGVAEFVAQCDALADAHGERFRPPQNLRDMAETGDNFYAA